MIAALFVQRDGVYWNQPGVDAYDEQRDARTYRGPHPAVVHSPCSRWVNLAAVNFKRYGGEHNRPGNDGGCFAHGLWVVRAFGGVLEHPAGSRAWSAYGLLRPPARGWEWAWWPDGHGIYWVCEVWQSAYGHLARKRTWLLYSGNVRPPELDWSRRPGTHQCGWFDRNKPTLGKKAASATPVAFRDLLISMARGAR